MLQEEDGPMEGLYLWLPRPQRAGQAGRCYLIIWPSTDAFTGSEHRFEPFQQDKS